jgi:hypothetical protein
MTLARPMFPPVDTARRGFLSQAAGVAAGSAVLAIGATIPAPAIASQRVPDPILEAIEAHRAARALHNAALEEQTRLEMIGDLPAAWAMTEAPCHAENQAFNKLIKTAPQTFAGLQAWAFYLDKSGEEWMLEEEGPTLVSTLARALGNLAATS